MWARLVATAVIAAAGFAWVTFQMARDGVWQSFAGDPLMLAIAIGDWLLEIGLAWLIICFLTRVRWLRRWTFPYFVMLMGVFYLFVDHFLTNNMYPGATYRSAAAALGVGTAFVALLNAWLLKRAVPGMGEKQSRLGNLLLAGLAAATLVLGERFLPALDKWHPFTP